MGKTLPFLFSVIVEPMLEPISPPPYDTVPSSFVYDTLDWQFERLSVYQLAVETDLHNLVFILFSSRPFLPQDGIAINESHFPKVGVPSGPEGITAEWFNAVFHT